MSLAAYIKRLRLKSGQSLQEVADAVGLSKAHVWELESGKSQNPTKEVLERLSNHFGVSVAQLIGETDDVSDEDSELAVMFRNLRGLGADERAHIQVLINSMKSRKKKD
jgi:transcriptional regulator with XRE-family HTH domain